VPVGLGRLFRRTPDDPVQGTFRVTRAVATPADIGYVTARISGVLSAPGIPAKALQVSRVYSVGEPVPERDDEVPAVIDRSRPERYQIAWPKQASPGIRAKWDEEHARRVAAAVRLGLEPSVVPDLTGSTVNELAQTTIERRYGRDLLPDGNRPVGVEEAEKLYTTGVAATATITGIDFLDLPSRALPNRKASIANVAVRVERPDGTAYTTTARFGFGTAARRAQIGYVGARVPVRVDPHDPARLCVDNAALPPLPDQGSRP
jgi:hypothetical protein